MSLRHRHPGPFWISVAASLAAVILAVGPNVGGTYDPTVATLCATLIAIVWYTFFSYCALHPSTPAMIKFEVRKGLGERGVVVQVQNLDPHRVVECRWRVLGWRNKSPIPTGEVLGEGAPAFVLRPGVAREQNFGLAEPAAVPGSGVGWRVQMNEPQTAVLRADLAWKDDAGASGYVGPAYFAVDVGSGTVVEYIVLAEAEKLWSECGGPALKRVAI